jgi:hypothetical protein
LARLEWDSEIVMTTSPRMAAMAALRTLAMVVRHPRSPSVEMRMGVHFAPAPSTFSAPSSAKKQND